MAQTNVTVPMVGKIVNVLVNQETKSRKIRKLLSSKL